MNIPQGYNEAQAYTGDFETLRLGGHVCIITGVKIEYTPNTNAQVLVISFDIAEGEQGGFYQRKYEEARKSNPQAKWQGIFRQFTQGNSLPYFKGLITNIEKSNPGYNFKNTGFNEQTLVGKLFGGIFGREQYKAQDGSLKFATKCMSIRAVEKIREGVEIPADKLLKEEQNNNYFSTDNNNIEDLGW